MGDFPLRRAPVKYIQLSYMEGVYSVLLSLLPPPLPMSDNGSSGMTAIVAIIAIIVIVAIGYFFVQNYQGDDGGASINVTLPAGDAQ